LDVAVAFPVIGTAGIVEDAEGLAVGLPVGTLVVAFTAIKIVMDAEGLAVWLPVGDWLSS
jgi:hypothetical protein